MHELSICQSILARAETVAAARASRVRRITLRIGPLAGVEPQALRYAFPLAAAGTCCEGAELVIDISVVRVKCRDCGSETEVRPNRLLCGACGTWRVALRAGDEMRIESLDLFQDALADV